MMFDWVGKEYLDKIAQIPSKGTLKPCKEESVNFDETENLYIEGDNLEVLKLLQKSYHNKVKMIYIDPPYNTGNDFVYKDNFKDNLQNYIEATGQVDREEKRVSANQETVARYHTNWLNMMYHRLSLARDLLTDDGVIFISIDDNEVNNLKKICDEIFGEDNFIGNFPVIMNLKGNQDKFCFAETHEYILVCTKNKNLFIPGMFPIDEEDLFDNWLEDDYGLYKEADNLRATGVNAPREKRPNLWYPIFLNEENMDFYITHNNKPKNENHTIILPVNPNGDELSWYWGKETFNKSKHNLILKKTTNGWQFYKKQRPQIGDLPTKKPKSVMYKSDYSTSTSTTFLKNMFGKKLFDSPKPLPFIYDLMLISEVKNKDIILDFFSGSATTAHAVMQLNAEDGGNRKHIMVQLPELTDEKSEAYKAGYKTICEIGKERIRRAGQKILEENKDKEGIEKLDIGFKVFKL